MTGSSAVADRVDAVVIGASAGGVEALSVVLPALPAGLRAPVFVGAAPAARAAQPAGGHLRPEVRGAGARGRGQGAGRAGHGLLRAARLPPAGRRRARPRAVGRRAGALSRGRRSTCCSSRRRTSIGQRAARHPADRRAARTARPAWPRFARPAASSWCRIRRRPTRPTMAEAALARGPRAPSCCRLQEIAELLRGLATAQGPRRGRGDDARGARTDHLPARRRPRREPAGAERAAASRDRSRS